MREDFAVVNRRVSDGGAPRPVQAIKCSACRDEDFISAHNGRAAAATIAAKFRKAGWRVGDVGEHLCPDCAARRRGGLPKEGAKMAAVKPINEDAIKAALPELYLELGASYDRAAKAYKGGASDLAIAAKLGLPPAIVAERRERDFGPLVESETARQRREAGEAALKAQKALDAEYDKLAAAIAATRSAAAAVKVAAQSLATAQLAAGGQEGRAA
jgi:hypothetical protein